MAKFLIYYYSIRETISEVGSPVGGSLVETLVWMRSLHELGHEIYLVSFEGDNRKILKEYTWIKTIDVYHPKKYRRLFVWFTYRLPKIYKLISQNNFDFVYIAKPHWVYYFTSVFCKLTKTKQIVRIANDKNVDKSLQGKQGFLTRLFYDKCIKNSEFVLAQNDFQYNKLKNEFNIKKVLKISNPIVLNKEYLEPKAKKKSYIAWLANFRYQKNLKLLFEVASLLKDQVFKVAGQPLNPLDEETKIYLQKLKTLSNVYFIGVISHGQVFEFLKGASYLLSTSRYEGFSNTFLESMLTGTPIITTSGVNPDGIIEKYSLGIIYENPEDLENKLNSVCENIYLQKSINCINYVIEHHDHLILGKKLMNFLEENK